MEGVGFGGGEEAVGASETDSEEEAQGSVEDPEGREAGGAGKTWGEGRKGGGRRTEKKNLGTDFEV